MKPTKFAVAVALPNPQNEPSVTNASTTGVKYVEQKWVSDFTIFIPGAKKGSICDQIFLEYQGISWD